MIDPIRTTLLCCLISLAACEPPGDDTPAPPTTGTSEIAADVAWRVHGLNNAETRFSPLADIDVQRYVIERAHHALRADR